MINDITVALITGGLSLLGVVFTCMTSNRNIQNQIEKNQAVTEYKVDELTREVREHNNFAKRMPIVEEQIKVINHRLADLEREVSNE